MRDTHQSPGGLVSQGILMLLDFRLSSKFLEFHEAYMTSWICRAPKGCENSALPESWLLKPVESGTEWHMHNLRGDGMLQAWPGAPPLVAGTWHTLRPHLVHVMLEDRAAFFLLWMETGFSQDHSSDSEGKRHCAPSFCSRLPAKCWVRQCASLLSHHLHGFPNSSMAPVKRQPLTCIVVGDHP